MNKKFKLKKIKVFSPASIANVAVGFDILGFAVSGIGDKIEIEIIKENNNTRKINLFLENSNFNIKKIPSNINKNTASVALNKLLADLNLNISLNLKITKGIPLSSGLGGSASSAVGAVYALNQMLKKPLKKKDLLQYALAGEKIASGAIHLDNIAPCLLGGLQLVLSSNPIEVTKISLKTKIYVVIINPNIMLETKQSRLSLNNQINLQEHIKQSACLAAFIKSCLNNDITLMRKSMHDIIIEPQRFLSIPEFKKAKQIALNKKAIGFSIAGSGPSTFAWTTNLNNAKNIRKELTAIYEKINLNPKTWITTINSKGAYVIP